MSLYNEKKHKKLEKKDEGKSFGKTFNYEYGRNKARKIAISKKLRKSK